MVDTLKVGPELDAEVARRVFGMPACTCGPIGGYDPTTGRCSRCEWRPCPEYSTDIADAWLVVEKLRERKIDVMVNWSNQRNRAVFGEDLLDPDDLRWECALWWAENDEHRETTQYGDTAPEAICRVAIRVTG